MNDLSQMLVPNTMLLDFLNTNLFLATHSETNCSSLLSAVISVSVVADVYSVESSVYRNTLAILMLLVKIEKIKGPRQLLCGIPDSTWIILERLPLKNTLCVLCDGGEGWATQKNSSGGATVAQRSASHIHGKFMQWKSVCSQCMQSEPWKVYAVRAGLLGALSEDLLEGPIQLASKRRN